MLWHKGLAVAFVISTLGLVSGRSSGPEFLPDEYIKSLQQRVSALDEDQHEFTKLLEDMLTSGSELKPAIDEAGSREELEEDKGETDNSASQENNKEETTKKPEEAGKPVPEDDDDDDDDDNPEAFFPVRGFSIFGNLPTIFGITSSKAWWTGPHVCVDREEKEEKSDDFRGSDFIAFGAAHFSTCQNTPTRYTCKTVTKKSGVTKTSVVSYQCCHGYRRTSGSQACMQVETRPISEIAAELGSDKFANMIKSAGLQSELDGNVTVFLPMDAALSDHHDSMDSMNQVDPILTNEVPLNSQSLPRDERSFVLGHVVDGVYEIADLNDEQVLKTKDDSTLRVNFLPNRVVTVNCIKLNATDRLTENGVVHVVDSVIVPVKQNLAEKLSEPRFSKFKQLLEENDLWELMSGEKGITVFAVENEGVEKIFGKYNMCMKNILAHHILPHTLCSATADSEQQLATLDLAKNWLPFTMKDGQMIVGNDTKVISADNIATNGILHVTEGFVIPSSARQVSELLNKTDHTEWLKVLEKSGLLSKIESSENMTMFVPTNSAVKAAIGDDMSQSELEELVKYHVGTRQEGNTVGTMLDGKNLTISGEKSMFPGLLGVGRFMSVQCAPITRLGGRVCNGLLHEIDSVLIPPSKTLWEFIESSDQLETLRKVLDGTKISSELKDGLDFPFTFLAPTNEAFDTIGQQNLDELLKDKTLADDVIRSHILREPVCCSNVVASTWPFIPNSPTLGGRPIDINRLGETTVFGAMPTTDCDNMVKGGVVHFVSKVRSSSVRQRDRELVLRRPNTEIILAGI